MVQPYTSAGYDSFVIPVLKLQNKNIFYVERVKSAFCFIPQIGLQNLTRFMTKGPFD